jgi:hypothetical protein
MIKASQKLAFIMCLGFFDIAEVAIGKGGLAASY